VTPGVTSPGWGPLLIPVLKSLLGSTLGSDAEVKAALHGIWKLTNPGLAHADVYEKGLTVIKHTKRRTFTEVFYITPSDILTNYTAVRAKYGAVTAPFHCGGSYVTEADEPGSLVHVPCGAIKFDSSFPDFFNMVVPAKMVCTDDMMATFTLAGKTKNCRRLSKVSAEKREIICGTSNAGSICPVSSFESLILSNKSGYLKLFFFH
jgi:hypothetical protein